MYSRKTKHLGPTKTPKEQISSKFGEKVNKIIKKTKVNDISSPKQFFKVKPKKEMFLLNLSNFKNLIEPNVEHKPSEKVSI